MATYKIDSNRGSDSNDGINAPWASMSKITSVTAVAGDEFLLASDSEFNLTARILLNSALGWSSTVANPVRFGVFYPAGAYKSRPIIRKRISIQASEWTYSAPNNAWTYTAANTISAYCYIKTGGQWATRTDNALPLDSYPGRWSNSGSTLYVYAPAGKNPTDYYGSVVLGPDTSEGVFVVSSPGSVQAMDFLGGWDFDEVGTGIYIFNSTGNRRYRIFDMSSYNTGAIFYCLTQTAGAVDLEIAYNRCRESGTTFISANTAAGVGISRWAVHDNVLDGCNYGFPQGAIYSQVRTGGVIAGNVIRRANYGVNGKASDGAAIYTETQSDATIITGNLIEDCYLGGQDNSGRSSTWIGNVFNRVHSVLKVTDTIQNNATNLTFRNNTAIACGTAIVPGAGSVSGIGIWGATATTPAQNFDIRNNIMSSVDASAAAIELPTNATGTIDTNNITGFSATAESWDGTPCNITPTNTTALDASVSPLFVPQSSALRSSGLALGGSDLYGNDLKATLGGVQAAGSRALSASRSVAARSVVDRYNVQKRNVAA